MKSTNRISNPILIGLLSVCFFIPVSAGAVAGDSGQPAVVDTMLIPDTTTPDSALPEIEPDSTISPAGTAPPDSIDFDSFAILKKKPYSFLINTFLATFGIIVAILSIMSSNTAKFREWMDSSIFLTVPDTNRFNHCLCRCTVRRAVLVFFVITSASMFAVMAPLFFPGINSVLGIPIDMLIRWCLLMLLMFLFLLFRMVYLILRY